MIGYNMLTAGGLSAALCAGGVNDTLAGCLEGGSLEGRAGYVTITGGGGHDITNDSAVLDTIIGGADAFGWSQNNELADGDIANCFAFEEDVPQLGARGWAASTRKISISGQSCRIKTTSCW